MSRPKIKENLRRSEPVYVTLRPQEKKRLDKLATSTGRSKSSLVREALLAWADFKKAKS